MSVLIFNTKNPIFIYGRDGKFKSSVAEYGRDIKVIRVDMDDIPLLGSNSSQLRLGKCRDVSKIKRLSTHTGFLTRFIYQKQLIRITKIKYKQA